VVYVTIVEVVASPNPRYSPAAPSSHDDFRRSGHYAGLLRDFLAPSAVSFPNQCHVRLPIYLTAPVITPVLRTRLHGAFASILSNPCNKRSALNLGLITLEFGLFFPCRFSPERKSNFKSYALKFQARPSPIRNYNFRKPHQSKSHCSLGTKVR